jgi:hypothetical protein
LKLRSDLARLKFIADRSTLVKASVGEAIAGLFAEALT